MCVLKALGVPARTRIVRQSCTYDPEVEHQEEHHRHEVGHIAFAKPTAEDVDQQRRYLQQMSLASVTGTQGVRLTIPIARRKTHLEENMGKSCHRMTVCGLRRTYRLFSGHDCLIRSTMSLIRICANAQRNSARAKMI